MAKKVTSTAKVAAPAKTIESTKVPIEPLRAETKVNIPVKKKTKWYKSKKTIIAIALAVIVIAVLVAL